MPTSPAITDPFKLSRPTAPAGGGIVDPFKPAGTDAGGMDAAIADFNRLRRPSVPASAPDRTWGEAASDVGRAFMSGAAGLVKTGGDLYGLATGNMDNLASELGRNAQEYWQAGQSDALKALKAQRAAAIDAADGTLAKLGTAVWETLKRPALLADVAAENAMTMLPAAGAGRGAALLTRAPAARAAAQRVGTQLAERGASDAVKARAQRMLVERAADKAAARAGVGTAIGVGGVQQGADVSRSAYDAALEGTDWANNAEYQARIASGEPAEAAKHAMALSAARATMPLATGISVASQALPGATLLERALVGGAARNTLARTGLVGRLVSGGRGAFGEGVQEATEEGGGQLAGNVVRQQTLDPNVDPWEDVGENAGIGFVGGALLGGPAGLLQRPEPRLQDGSPVPDAKQGPLSRAVNRGVQSGAIPTAVPFPSATPGGLADAANSMRAAGKVRPAEPAAPVTAEEITARAQSYMDSLNRKAADGTIAQKEVAQRQWLAENIGNPAALAAHSGVTLAEPAATPPTHAPETDDSIDGLRESNNAAPPPNVPWFDQASGELREPTDVEVRDQFLRLFEAASRAGTGTSIITASRDLAKEWGVEPTRLRALRKAAVADRKAGITPENRTAGVAQEQGSNDEDTAALDAVSRAGQAQPTVDDVRTALVNRLRDRAASGAISEQERAELERLEAMEASRTGDPAAAAVVGAPQSVTPQSSRSMPVPEAAPVTAAGEGANQSPAVPTARVDAAGVDGVMPGAHVTITHGKHAGKGGTVFRAGAKSIGVQFEDGSKASLSPKVVAAATNTAERAGTDAPGTDDPVTMQNRDRSRLASVAQMQAIARNPDPSRLGFSRDPNTGAPMVGEGRVIPDADKGRADVVTMASGRIVPVRYAVVEAADVAASHGVTGAVNPDYQTADLKALNNGRSAGIQAAWQAGNGETYRAGIIGDAALHGVSADAIRSKKSPMLVRLYAPDENTGDMGAESNMSQQLGLSPVEQAQTDARALPSLENIEWADDGSLSPAANAGFFRAWFHNLGDTQAATLQDAQGRPNAEALRRVRAAMVHRVYGDERLLTALVEETDPDNRNVMHALVRAAPAFAALDEKHPLVRSVLEAITGGFQMLRDAAARGLTINDAIAQQDMFGRNRAADAIALFMGENARSPKRMAHAFEAMARYLGQAESGAATLDIFGTRPAPTIRAALEHANEALAEEGYAARIASEQAEDDPGAVGVGRSGGEREEDQRTAAEGADAAPALTLTPGDSETLAAEAAAARVPPTDEFTLTGESKSDAVLDDEARRSMAASQRGLFSARDHQRLVDSVRSANDGQESEPAGTSQQVAASPAQDGDRSGVTHGARVTITQGKHAGKAGTVFRAGAKSIGVQFEDGSKASLSPKVVAAAKRADATPADPRGAERTRINEGFDTLLGELRTRTNDDGTVGLFSTGDLDAEPDGETISASERHFGAIRQAVNEVRRNWGANAPAVRLVARPSELPEAARRDPRHTRARGFYYQGAVWLVTDNLPTERMALATLAHEAVGHYGVDRIIDAHVPGGWDRLQADIMRVIRNPSAGTRALQEVAAEVRRRYGGRPEREQAREFVAIMAERGLRNSFMGRVLAALRAWVRRMFPGVRFNDADLRALLARADAELHAGQVADGQQEAARAWSFSAQAMPFYSALEQAVVLGRGAPRKASAQAWKQWLDGAQRRGEFKQSERDWLGVDQWLDAQDGVVQRQALAEFIQANQVQVQDVVLRDNGSIEAEDGPAAKYSEFQTPGGENYRELLLTLPPKLDTSGWYVRHPDGSLRDSFWSEVEARARAEDVGGTVEPFAYASRKPYLSNHFDQPNILAHVRFNERTDAYGKRVLFLEEVQSDWHQAGRKGGYAGQNAQNARRAVVPNAPFKGTDEWAMLAFKRMVRWAAENGFDRIAWTTGEQQAERYDLSKQVDRIAITSTGGVWVVTAWRDGAQVLSRDARGDGELSALVGKDLAERAVKEGGGDYAGVDLKVGGDGMRAFYDKILPAAVNKWAKNFGWRVGETTIDTGDDDAVTVHAIDVTPAMREAALDGLPLFSFAGTKARTADLGKLDEAMALENIGRDSVPMRDGRVVGSPSDTHRSTGWHRGVDGRWRWEIDDSAAKVRMGWLAQAKAGGTTLDQVLDHPALFEAYPHLAQVRVRVVPSTREMGSYDPRTNVLTVRGGAAVYDARGPNSLRSLLLHEVQHAIQSFEGFAGGGNIKHAKTMPEYQQFLMAANAKGLTDAELRAAYTVYHRLAGEVEARNVQRRAGFTPEQRRRFTPTMTQDVERGKQIVRIAGGVAASAGGLPQRRNGIPAASGAPVALWRNDRPLKADPDYQAAKAGDGAAAIRLVGRAGAPLASEAASRFGSDVVYVAAHAEEATGRNAIPVVLAAYLAAKAGGRVDDRVVQENRTFHTGADAMQRMLARSQFSGAIAPGTRYVLVDDVTTMGGTLADLAQHIQAGGGEVVGTVVLVNAAREGGKLHADRTLLSQLERRFGDEIREQFGIEPAALTAAEARYLIGFRSVAELRQRVASAAQARADRLRAKGIQPARELGQGVAAPAPSALESPDAGVFALAERSGDGGAPATRGKSVSVATDKTVAGKQGQRAAGDESRRDAGYRMRHRPAGPDFGSRLDDLSQAFSADIYWRNAADLHGHGVEADQKAIHAIQRARGNPDAKVKIYRAVPKDAASEIQPGDWVTLTREYAVEHGEGLLGGDYRIITATVPAGTLFNEGNSIHEFGYHPNDPSAPESSGDFSLADPAATVETIDQALGDPDGTAFERAKAWLRGKGEQLVPAALGALQRRHLTELIDGHAALRTFGKQYDELVQSLEADRTQLIAGAPDAAEHPDNMLKKGAAVIAEELRKFTHQPGLAGWQGRRNPEADVLARVMHDATIEGLDPSEGYTRLTMENAQGELVPWTKEAIKERIRALRAQMRGRSDGDKREMMAEAKRLRNLPARERARERAWPRLLARYQALSAQAKALYQQQRDWYSQVRDEVEKALIARIEAVGRDMAAAGGEDISPRYVSRMVSRIRLQFESARQEGVYFPLSRDGDFWMSVTDGDGQQGFLMFESAADARAAEKKLRAKGFTIEAQGRRGSTYRAKDAPSGTFVAEVIAGLRKSGVPENVLDDVYQSFLRTLPEMSMRKHSIHRRKVPGFSQDILRAFSKNAFHGAFQLARLRHAHKLQAILDAARGSLDNYRRAPEAEILDVSRGDALLGELRRRHDYIMAPDEAQLANVANAIGFVYYLGVTPAAAIVNLTQNVQVTLPVLGAAHGWGKATRALWAAWRDSARTGGNIQRTLTNDEDRTAYNTLMARGDINKTSSHTLAGLAEGNQLKSSPVWAKTMDVISFLFHKAEVVNREAAGIAAFRLARSRGDSLQDAIQYASDIINGTHFDYGASNRPRYMQGNAMRVVTQFKSYSIGMTWLLYRNLYQAVRGESAEVKANARRTLTGVLGMTGILAGVAGMPVYNAIKYAAMAAQAAFGDDDEPWDFDVEFRKWLADNLGPEAAGFLADGPVNQLTGMNVGSRVSLSNLWFRDSDRPLEGVDAYHAALEAIVGPMGGLTKNLFVGTQRISEGNLWRGVETMMPKFAKDAMKATRFAAEGANTLRGDPIVPDVRAGELFAQAIGFQPVRLAEQYRENSALKNYEQFILDRRQSLMNAYAMAVRTGADRAEVMERIRAFNRRYPEIPINGDTLRRSLRTRARYSAQADGGVAINRRLAPRLREAVLPSAP